MMNDADDDEDDYVTIKKLSALQYGCVKTKDIYKYPTTNFNIRYNGLVWARSSLPSRVGYGPDPDRWTI